MTERTQLSPTQIARKYLEDKLSQSIAGSNRVKSNPSLYGQLGLQGGEVAYEDAMNSDAAKKLRDEIYAEEKARGEGLGVYGEPTQPSNYQVSTKLVQILEDSKRAISLKDLGEVVKQLAPDFKFEVPKELEAYVPNELLVKVQGDTSKLTEDEQYAIQTYKVLSGAYNRAVELKATKSGHYADLNQAAEQITEKYKKPEKK